MSQDQRVWAVPCAYCGAPKDAACVVIGRDNRHLAWGTWRKALIVHSARIHAYAELQAAP